MADARVQVADELVEHLLLRGEVEVERPLRDAAARGEIATADPEVTAWALMAMGEMLGMRWLLWQGKDEMPPDVLAAMDELIVRVLSP